MYLKSTVLLVIFSLKSCKTTKTSLEHVFGNTITKSFATDNSLFDQESEIKLSYRLIPFQYFQVVNRKQVIPAK